MRLFPLAFALLFASPVAAQTCGGSFGSFVAGLKSEAVARGLPAATADAFLAGVRQDDRTLRADRSQGVFRLEFVDFARRIISGARIRNGAANAQRYDRVFDAVEAQYGVPRGVLLAFWALETDYGAVQGDFNTRNSLVTLAHDCRRPELFRPQVFAAMELFARGQFDLGTTGAWAGEIGQVQMLPKDILERGVDGDGDGRVTLKTSVPDALHSGARFLQDIGWQAGQPWLVEVTVPDTLDWSQTGLDTKRPVADWLADGVVTRGPTSGMAPGQAASLLLPQGRKGPAFLAFANYEVLFEWNKSFVYVTTAAYFATRLSGAPVFNVGTPEPGISGSDMERLQRKLVARGHDVGAIDGILGRLTRRAVQAEQKRLGLPADAWPTAALLRAL
ncbi:lytic transglycosylase [Jannaschia pagri]|uniref:Lytic transglycosylase n=1 Tax=Jannaschia pagri TaxID=2829797 RepID=A0ABQ4NI41_9RHOB|nr:MULTISPECIES: lytic murein transglycosylase [unclassified Jannaschia]GIT89826.1 lytic transglycosylase [Jannaschia sp. AI_61]GIT94067.1 lytic transglycosylase [Jannaschia sp. AI_62]